MLDRISRFDAPGRLRRQSYSAPSGGCRWAAEASPLVAFGLIVLGMVLKAMGRGLRERNSGTAASG